MRETDHAASGATTLAGWLKRFWNWIVLAAVTLGLLFVAWPASSAIYFEGAADHAVFTLASGGRDVYAIKSNDEYGGTVEFHFGETDTLYVINTHNRSEEEIQRSYREGYPGWKTSDEVFPFEQGIATLFSESGNEPGSDSLYPTTLTLESADGRAFNYNMEVVRGEGDGEQNRIELRNFPVGLTIKLHRGSDISMKGTNKKVPGGQYRIMGCTSITFYAVPLASVDLKLGYSPVNSNLTYFKFTNAGKNTFETTYRAETNFTDIGHVEMEGYAQKGKDLSLEIGDLGQYPLPIKLSGQAGALTMGGVNCYPNWKQWVLDKRSELLLSIAGLYIGTMFRKDQEKKSDVAGEGPQQHPPEDPCAPPDPGPGSA